MKPMKILALGADIKNRFLFVKNNSFYFGPDIGDLSQAKNFQRFKKEISRAIKRFKPDIIACDLHPNYFSSVFAKEINHRLPTANYKPIQHHHAHIASVMQEHNLKGKILGVSFDGTGYGTDGHSWGGEFLLVEKTNCRRLAHLKYRMMPGADKVVSEPWRMALSILREKAFPFLKTISKKDKDLILKMLARNINSPLASSAGRLFDAAAALLGICSYASYEAEGPMKLEAICDERIKNYYGFTLNRAGGSWVINTDKIFLEMLKDLKEGTASQIIATKFHNSMAEIVVAMARNFARSFQIKNIALSGGVFQNNFLRKKAIKELSDSGLNVFTNINTPLNDFNISLGQYYVSGNCGKN